MRVDTLKCRVIKSFGFVRKSVAARAGWWFQMDKNNGTGNPNIVKHVGTKTHLEYSGFHTTRQWQKDIFLSRLLPLLWGKARMQGGLKL